MGFIDWFKAKFQSRKFLMALGGFVLTVGNEILGWGLSEQSFWFIWGFVMVYILGEAYVDGKKTNV